MEDYKALQDRVQFALVATTKAANSLSNEDLPFQRTANPSVGDDLDKKTERLLKLSNGLIDFARGSRRVATLEEIDDVEINWKPIVDVIDSLLEKADMCLDEYTGLIKSNALSNASNADSNQTATKSKSSSRNLDPRLKRANILKPQNAFERQIDNFDDGPWKPILTAKPHAKISLDQSLAPFTDEEGKQQYDYSISLPLAVKSPSSMIQNESELDKKKKKRKRETQRRESLRKLGSGRGANGRLRFRHPYEREVLDIKYPDAIYENREPIMYQPVETTSAVLVDTYEGVLEMLEELKKAKEIAVDLEHHDFRTYAGLLSLMQISTRDKDWVIDTLQPWRHKLEVLNEVFTDPNILKVFHGAYMDIIWLQRDLGLYMVGLFDTFYACEALAFPGKSLAFLLKKFANFDADKKYQLADWRIRPLPEEMLYYARSDTHYLLYVYDMLRNELLRFGESKGVGKNLLQLVLEKSKEVSLQRYEGLTANPETGHGPRGWYNSIVKSSTLFDSEQLSVYRAVHQWRDQKARREDESPVFLMSQQVLTDIAKILPSDQKALWSLLQTHARNLQPHLADLLKVIQDARQSGIGGPTLMDILRTDSVGSTAKRAFGDKTADKEVTSEQEAIPIVSELRSDHSQLWGDVPMSTVWENAPPRKLSKGNNEQRIALPWTQYVQDTSTSDHSSAAPSSKIPPAETDDVQMAEDEILLEPTKPSARPSPQEPESNEEFVIKKKGSKKRKASREEPEPAGDEDAQANAVQEEEEPFDYSTAQSVLHAPRTSGKGDGKGKMFDPIAKKAGDAPKGVRNHNSHKAGKTATFKK